jgi:hypothetical protein
MSPKTGKTYTLLGPHPHTPKYLEQVEALRESFMHKCQEALKEPWGGRLVGEKVILDLITDVFLTRSARQDRFRSCFLGDFKAQKRMIHEKIHQLMGMIPHKEEFGHVLRRLAEDFESDAQDFLGAYTFPVKKHLKNLSLSAQKDSSQRTTQAEYHLYMVGISILNRHHRGAFLAADPKIAFAAHCLRDFREVCRAYPTEVDYVCAGCTEECQVNQARLLMEGGDQSLVPRDKLYLALNQDTENLFQELKNKYPRLGLIGVACVTELYWGMQLADSLGIPSQGVLLNYNRCARWLGEAKETDFDLEELKRILEVGD